MRLVAAVTLLVGAVALAGCSGGSGDTTDRDTVPRSATGTLHGVVTDEEFLPVSGATVSFRAGADGVMADLTDKAGAWRIDGVPAGSIQVSAQKIGYLGATHSVTLLPGQEKQVNFEIQSLGDIFSAFNETISFNGKYTCASDSPMGSGSCDQAVQDGLGSGVFDAQNNHSYRVPTGWGGILFEVNWTAGAGGEAITGAGVTLASMDNGTAFVDAAGPGNPFRAWVNATEVHPGASDGAAIPIEGVDAWLSVRPYGQSLEDCPVADGCPAAGGAVEMDYTVWVTVFYRSTVDLAYSAVPTA